MSRFFRARLVSLGAAVLFSSAVFAQNSRALPEQTAAPDVPLVAKPSEGPQTLDPPNLPDAAKADEKAAKPEGQAASSEPTTTTLAVTSETSSTSSNAPDKAFAAGIKAPHNGSFTTSIDVEEPD
jgi:hypothetical protein